jgi:CRP-like cAMP-binding protein
MNSESTQETYLETYLPKPWRRDFFSFMTPKVQNAFDGIKEPRSFQAGEQVLAQGSVAQGVFIVVTGQLSVQRKSSQGQYQVLRIVLPGESVGVIAVFDGEPTPCGVVAETDTTCWFVPAKPLRMLAFQYQEVGQMIHHHTCARYRNLVEVLEGMSLHSVPERVAKLLLDRHLHNPSQSLLLEFPEGEEDLAHYIACSRSTFSRALRQLNDEGMIRNTFPVVRIVDMPRLEAFASCGSRALGYHRVLPQSLNSAV